VRRLELSYRRRRRLVALTVVAVVVAGIAAAIVLLPKGEKLDQPTSTPATARGNGAASHPRRHRRPHPTHLSAADRKQMKTTIALFVTSSVSRHHPERSWAIVDPALREGLTKKEWSAGNIPVVPYPAAGVNLLTLESMIDQTALVEVVLEPASGSHLVRKTFQIELHRVPSSSRRWLVSSWVPEGVSESQQALDAANEPQVVSKPEHLSQVWLFAVLGLLVGGLILFPAGLLFRESYQYRRAKHEFEHSHDEHPGLRG